MKKKYIITGIVLITLSIVLGAFGAHGLKKVLVSFPEKLTSFETGVKYQMYMGLSFLWLGTLKVEVGKYLYPILLVGVIFFSLSIYLLSIDPVISFSFSFLGPVTPIGGLLLIIGWLYLLVNIIKSKI
jgi:uncharacterized membrane protein YgdD (TMEM256/DUF423 family)